MGAQRCNLHYAGSIPVLHFRSDEVHRCAPPLLQIVVVDAQGRSSFQKRQRAMRKSVTAGFVYQMFDLMTSSASRPRDFSAFSLPSESVDRAAVCDVYLAHNFEGGAIQMVTKSKDKARMEKGKLKVGKLKLNKETVRVLADGEQKQVKGGSGAVCQTVPTVKPMSKAGLTC